MQRTRVKICGVMRKTDALAAVAAGADAIGFVFHKPSRRCIEPSLAFEIVAALPPLVTAIGLFVDQSAEQIRAVARQVGISTVQLHGVESVQTVSELAGLRVIKMLPGNVRLPEALREWDNAIRRTPLPQVAAILIDAPGGGGAGIDNDWTAVESALRANGSLAVPIVLAGGLNPQNVAAVIRRLSPYAVDVSSGVESAYGEKSPEKIAAFIDQVNRADSAAKDLSRE